MIVQGHASKILQSTVGMVGPAESLQRRFNNIQVAYAVVSLCARAMLFKIRNTSNQPLELVAGTTVAAFSPLVTCGTRHRSCNEAFIGVMSGFEPLTEEVCVMENAEDEPIQVTSDIVVKKLRQLSTTKANGPDDLPNWLLKTYADIIALVVTDILNCSNVFKDEP